MKAANFNVTVKSHGSNRSTILPTDRSRPKGM